MVTPHQRLPSAWNDSFEVSFWTNITATEGGGVSSDKIIGTLYYSYPFQRIDHGAGSFECVHFYNTTKDPCSLFFLPNNNMYRVVGNDDCCLDLPGIGTPPPNWAALAQPTGTGWVWDAVSSELAYEWVFDHQLGQTEPQSIEYHTLRESSSAGEPVLFTFPGHRQQDYHFRVDTLRVGPQDPALFRLPVQGCEDTTCAAATARSRLEMALSTPLVMSWSQPN